MSLSVCATLTWTLFIYCRPSCWRGRDVSKRRIDSLHRRLVMRIRDRLMRDRLRLDGLARRLRHPGERLRLQRERMSGGLLPSEGEFYRLFGLTTARLAGAKPDAIVMHPGPINRGVEIESAVADGPQSVILNQVTYGIAIRMAVLSMAMSGQTAQRQFEQENAQ